MEREIVLNEYLKLRNYLNQSNKIANEATKLKFEITQISLSEFRMFALVRNRCEEHRIALAVRDKTRSWERSGYTPFRNLEIFCANELNAQEDVNLEGCRTFILTNEQIINLNQHINSVFDNLLFG